MDASPRDPDEPVAVRCHAADVVAAYGRRLLAERRVPQPSSEAVALAEETAQALADVRELSGERVRSRGRTLSAGPERAGPTQESDRAHLLWQLRRGTLFQWRGLFSASILTPSGPGGDASEMIVANAVCGAAVVCNRADEPYARELLLIRPGKTAAVPSPSDWQREVLSGIHDEAAGAIIPADELALRCFRLDALVALVRRHVQSYEALVAISCNPWMADAPPQPESGTEAVMPPVLPVGIPALPPVLPLPSEVVRPPAVPEMVTGPPASSSVASGPTMGHARVVDELLNATTATLIRVIKKLGSNRAVRVQELHSWIKNMPSTLTEKLPGPTPKLESVHPRSLPTARDLFPQVPQELAGVRGVISFHQFAGGRVQLTLHSLTGYTLQALGLPAESLSKALDITFDSLSHHPIRLTTQHAGASTLILAPGIPAYPHRFVVPGPTEWIVRLAQPTVNFTSALSEAAALQRVACKDVRSPGYAGFRFILSLTSVMARVDEEAHETPETGHERAPPAAAAPPQTSRDSAGANAERDSDDDDPPVNPFVTIRQFSRTNRRMQAAAAALRVQPQDIQRFLRGLPGTLTDAPCDAGAFRALRTTDVAPSAGEMYGSQVPARLRNVVGVITPFRFGAGSDDEVFAVVILSLEGQPLGFSSSGSNKDPVAAYTQVVTGSRVQSAPWMGDRSGGVFIRALGMPAVPDDPLIVGGPAAWLARLSAPAHAFRRTIVDAVPEEIEPLTAADFSIGFKGLLMLWQFMRQDGGGAPPNRAASAESSEPSPPRGARPSDPPDRGVDDLPDARVNSIHGIARNSRVLAHVARAVGVTPPELRDFILGLPNSLSEPPSTHVTLSRLRSSNPITAGEKFPGVPGGLRHVVGVVTAYEFARSRFAVVIHDLDGRPIHVCSRAGDDPASLFTQGLSEMSSRGGEVRWLNGLRDRCLIRALGMPEVDDPSIADGQTKWLARLCEAPSAVRRAMVVVGDFRSAQVHPGGASQDFLGFKFLLLVAREFADLMDEDTGVAGGLRRRPRGA